MQAWPSATSGRLSGAPSPDGVLGLFVVGDADQLRELHRSRGVEIAHPLDDRPYGLRDYTVRDLNGNRLTFGHRLMNAGPPIDEG